jgi:hypothetical protein
MMTKVMEADLGVAEVRMLVLGALREIAQVQLFLRTIEQRDVRYAALLDTEMSSAAAVDDELSAKLGDQFCQARRCRDASQKARRLERCLRVMAEHAAMTLPPYLVESDDSDPLSDLHRRLNPLLLQHASFAFLGDVDNHQELAMKVEKLYKEHRFALRRFGFDMEAFLVIAGDPVWTNRREILFESIPAALARLSNA